MSYWARLGLKIEDLTCFKLMCDRHGIEYTADESGRQMYGGTLVASMKDKTGGGQAYLVRKDGAIKMHVDNDPRYSSITKRLGKNGGKLTRDYAQETIRKGVAKAGGIVNQTTESPDGSLVMRISRAV